jgi:hypothetical protein
MSEALLAWQHCLLAWQRCCCLLLAHRGWKANGIAPAWPLLDLLYKNICYIRNILVYTMHSLVL